MRRAAGIATTSELKDHAFEHSQAFIDDVKKLGCNAIVVPYDCGFGEAANEEEVQQSRAFIKRAHGCGLRVGVYFRCDNVWPETLSEAEHYELKGGLQVDQNGHSIKWFGGGWGSSGQLVCYHHQGTLARLQRHIRRAIVELEVDMLHLDGMIVGGFEGAGACRCPKCIEDFRAFLIRRYGLGGEPAATRFGHASMDRVLPPSDYPRGVPYDTGPANPHWCEWTAFRCEWTSRILAEVAALARELNPEVVIEINNALPAVRENVALFMGTDVLGIGHYTDASWAEDGYAPKLLGDGKLIQRVRQFKLCRAVKTFAITYMCEAEERALRQNLAHAAAFNGGNIGCMGFPPTLYPPLGYARHFQLRCDFMQWFHAHSAFFRKTRSLARIAVWRPRANMALSSRLAYAASMRVEQWLIETRRGFDIVLDETPSALSGYDLVILPNLECMSLDQVQGLLAHVEKGGSLLVGQDSAAFDLWHRRRSEGVWANLFGSGTGPTVGEAVVVTPAGAVGTVAVASADTDPRRVTFGRGKAVYFPRVVDPATQPSLTTVQGELDCALDYTNWVVPEQTDDLERSVNWLMEGHERIRVTGQRGLLAESLGQDGSSRQMIHLVNLLPEPQRNCVVTICPSVNAQQITMLSPPTDRPPEWHSRSDGTNTQIEFDFLDTYAVICVP
ncbi:MAG: hypothetical protein PHR35_05970 [Kiritimatiellae bacterium]|nr:hypothetical protein [Kiritimatiellia bacterium]